MNRKRIALAVLSVCVLLVAVGGAVYFPRARTASLPGQAPKTLDELRTYWGAEIDRAGAQKAYAEFKDFYTASTSNAHVAAHVMGELLYVKEGLAGIGVCDGSFSYGCYHEFISRALLERGPDAVKELTRACDQYSAPMRAACAHGVGHGVLAYYGTDRILDALDTCAQLFQAGGASGCANGVFMEYNAPLVLGDETAEVHARPLDMRHPLSPCDMPSISAEFARACYRSLPAYWWNSVGGIEGVAKLCASAPGAYREACYTGIGFQLPGSVSYDEHVVLTECQRLADKGTVGWCLSGSANVQEQFGKSACAIYTELGVAKEHGC